MKTQLCLKCNILLKKYCYAFLFEVVKKHLLPSGDIIKFFLGEFYRSPVITSRNMHDIFFNVIAKKEAKCIQSNDKRNFCAQLPVIGKIRLMRKKKKIIR